MLELDFNTQIAIGNAFTGSFMQFWPTNYFILYYITAKWIKIVHTYVLSFLLISARFIWEIIQMCIIKLDNTTLGKYPHFILHHRCAWQPCLCFYQSKTNENIVSSSNSLIGGGIYWKIKNKSKKKEITKAFIMKG